MGTKILEFTDVYKQPQELGPSSIIFRKDLKPKMNEREHKVCSVFGCYNSTHNFSNICYGHYKDYLNYGTYFPNNPITFRKDINPRVKELKNISFESESLDLLVQKLERFLDNPFSCNIKLIKGGVRNTPSTSKELQAKWIKENHTKRIPIKTIALRLIVVWELFQEGRLDGGSPLRFLLYRCICPTDIRKTASIPTKEAIGQTLLSNFLRELKTIL